MFTFAMDAGPKRENAIPLEMFSLGACVHRVAWPEPAQRCQFCEGFARVPFQACRCCGARPGWHHGRCCPCKPRPLRARFAAGIGVGVGVGVGPAPVGATLERRLVHEDPLGNPNKALPELRPLAAADPDATAELLPDPDAKKECTHWPS
jgi:hypothetical protein